MQERFLRTVVPALALASILLSAGAARAEIMQTSGSLPAGGLSLGAEFQAGVYASPAPWLLNLHEAVGLIGGVDLYAREGLGLRNANFYVGAGVKWTPLTSRSDRPGIAILAGGHYVSSELAGADGSLLIDYTIKRVTPYLGLDTNLDFYSSNNRNDVDFKLGLIGGARIGLVPHVAWYVEGGLGITGDPKPHFITTGPKITL
jgi:hypothetical protein